MRWENFLFAQVKREWIIKVFLRRRDDIRSNEGQRIEEKYQVLTALGPGRDREDRRMLRIFFFSKNARVNCPWLKILVPSLCLSSVMLSLNGLTLACHQ